LRTWKKTRMFLDKKFVPYQTKIIITDSVIHYYTYSRTMFKGKTGKTNYSKSKYGEKNEYSIRRSKSNLFLTVSSNITPYSKFMTLTTRRTTLERDDILIMFNQFRKNFMRIFNTKLKYVGVLERQKKRGLKENNEGSWHIHLIVFNDEKLVFVKLKQAWTSFGSIDIKAIKHYTHIPVYLMKYLTKETIGLNKKSIIKSQGLKKEEIIYHHDIIIPEDLPNTYHDYYVMPDDTIVWFYEKKINRILHLENNYIQPFVF
jgi:hypothetical protein